MLDSADRNQTLYTFPNDFQIYKSQPLTTGHFTRASVTEMVLNWFTPNINATIQNNVIILTNITVGAFAIFTVPDGFYTIASLIDCVVAGLNAQAGVTLLNVSSIATPQPDTAESPRTITFVGAPATQFSLSGPVAEALGINFLGYEIGVIDGAPVPYNSDLRLYKYLDFTSEQLTYNQEVKDASTSAFVKDVMLRWYFAWDDPTTYDAYGYPILQGYVPFVERRLFNPPKYIKWNSAQPVGGLKFEVYGDGGGTLAFMTFKSDWQMTIQLSEN